MQKRRYRLRQRAEQQEETRRRIVQAAMELHGEVGPRMASISAIAERAGVQRLTVYRHFPDDGALFQACSSKWLSLNPPPGPANWAGTTDRKAALKTALRSLYRYYGRTEGMWTSVYRDLGSVEALVPVMDAFHEHLATIARDLLERWGLKSTRRKVLRAAMGHALRFSTWQSLHEEGLDARRAADLMCGWLEPMLEAANPKRCR